MLRVRQWLLYPRVPARAERAPALGGSARADRAPVARCEPLEPRRLLSAVARPDHIVVVIEQDRASGAVGNPLMPYFNALARTGLVFTNAHGVTHPSLPNALALYSGSTQGRTDNGRGHSFGGPNLAKSLFAAGQSFAAYVENLPSDGSQVQQAGTAQYPDLYTRNVNAAAMFTDVGIDPATGRARPNSAVNRTFAAFSALPVTDYSALPTVSFVIPNNLNSTHGSNLAYPWAGSSDEQNNDVLRTRADGWLKDNLDPYLRWARENNSLLIVTQDEERWVGGTADSVTTIIDGDPDLVVPGVNGQYVDHFNLLRTIQDMYGLAPLGNSATAAPFHTDALGRLAPPGPAGPVEPGVTLTAAAASTAFGQPVTLTARVSGPGGTPTGAVTFLDGANVLGAGTLDADGVATLSTAALAVGTHSLTVRYAGDATTPAATSPALNLTVRQAATTTTLVSSATPSGIGQPVTFTAVVAPVAPGAGSPSGHVQFRINGALYGAPVALVNGSATAPATASLGAGAHAVTATYSGDANFTAGTPATLTQNVSASNDAFAGRLTLAGATATATGSNAGATREAGEPRHVGNAGGRSVWWSWTAPAAGTLTLDTFGSTFDTLLAVYAGAAVGALSPIPGGSNDDAPGAGTASKVKFDVTAGATYQIAVDGYNGATGNIALRATLAVSVPAPANDRFADRAVLTGTAATVTASNAGASRDAGEPAHAGNAGGRSVWWTWTAPTSGMLTIDTFGSTFDTLLAVYTGTDLGSLAAVTGGSNDDDWANNTNTSRVRFAVTAGTTYQIAVDGYNAAQGNITLRLSLT
jgi:hypothetical protein